MPRKARTQRAVMDFAGLADEWDACPDVRARVRDEGAVLDPKSDGFVDITTCCRNASLLVPLVTRMALSKTRDVPGVDGLRDSVVSLLTMNQRPNEAADMAEVVRIGWALRKLAGFLKMKVRRKEVSYALGL